MIKQMSKRFIEDRVTQGFIAGMSMTVFQLCFTFTMYYGFHLIKYRFLDFAAWIAFNQAPQGLFQTVIAEVIVAFFLGFLGIFFSLLIKNISSANLIFKGALYGIFCWFVIYGVIAVFRVKGIYPVNFMTSFIHLIGGTLWGTAMAAALLFLNRKYGVRNGE